MQKCMASEEAGERNNPAAESNIARLLDAWHDGGHAIIHVRHISRSPASLFLAAQPGAEFQAALTSRADEHVVEKSVPDAFLNTELERWRRCIKPTRDRRADKPIGRLRRIGRNTNIDLLANSAEAPFGLVRPTSPSCQPSTCSDSKKDAAIASGIRVRADCAAAVSAPAYLWRDDAFITFADLAAFAGAAFFRLAGTSVSTGPNKSSVSTYDTK